MEAADSQTASDDKAQGSKRAGKRKKLFDSNLRCAAKTPTVSKAGGLSNLPPAIVAGATFELDVMVCCREEWLQFKEDLTAADRAAKVAEGGFAFAFKEGALVQALRNGDWVLLDEINLAPSEVRALLVAC